MGPINVDAEETLTLKRHCALKGIWNFYITGYLNLDGTIKRSV